MPWKVGLTSRMNSFGASTLITSAPSHARRVAENGPTPPTPKSTTRRPASGRRPSASRAEPPRPGTTRHRPGQAALHAVAETESARLGVREAFLDRQERHGRSAVGANERDRLGGRAGAQAALVDRSGLVDIVTPADRLVPARLEAVHDRGRQLERLDEPAPLLESVEREIERDAAVARLVAGVDEALARPDVGAGPCVRLSPGRPDDRLQRCERPHRRHRDAHGPLAPPQSRERCERPTEARSRRCEVATRPRRFAPERTDVVGEPQRRLHGGLRRHQPTTEQLVILRARARRLPLRPSRPPRRGARDGACTQRSPAFRDGWRRRCRPECSLLDLLDQLPAEELAGRSTR